MLSTYLLSSRAVFLTTNVQDKSIIVRDCIAFRNELQPEEAVLCLCECMCLCVCVCVCVCV
jgi:hypothetical protein